MSISSDAIRKAGPFNGNGTTTVFPFAFKVFTASDLLVVRTDPNNISSTLALTADYTVQLNSNQDATPGGTVTLNTAPPNGYTLVIGSTMPAVQPLVLTNTGGFYPASLNDEFDRLTILVQQLAEKLGRTLQFSIADQAVSFATLPNATARRNTVQGYDANGYPTLFALPSSVGAGDIRADTFTAGVDFTPGVTAQLTLSRAPGSAPNVEIFFDSAFQGPDQWTLNGAVVTFSAAIPVGVGKVFVRSGSSLSTQIPAVGSVGDAQLTWGGILGRVTDSVAAMAALNPGVYTRSFPVGYATPADGGGGPYVYSASTPQTSANGGTIIASTFPGATGCWLLATTSFVSVKQFGAKGDGVTDDTAAIQAAITACYGRTLYFPLPSNFYYLNSTSGLTIVGQIHLLGEIGTFIKYGSALSNATDVITFNGNALAVEGFEIEHLWIVEASGSPARDVLRINLNSTSGLKKLRVSRNMFRSKNGYAININNPSGASVNTNGLFLTVIEKNELYGGIAATNLGDSVTICDNVITGPNTGITAGMLPSSNPTGSSSSFIIERNNITALGGAISINPARNLRIVGNNIEQIAALPGGYSISLANVDWGSTLGASVVENNKVEAADGTAQCGALSMFQCNNTVVRNNNLSGSSKPSSFTYTVAITSGYQVKILDNTIYASTNCVGVGVIDSGSTYTALFGNRYSLASGAASIQDNGTGTKGVWRALTYNTGWSRYGGTETGLSVFKDRNSMVYLRGRIQKSTAIVANDLVATLPSGFLPDDSAGGATGGGLHLPGTYSKSTDGTSTTAAIRVLSASSGSPGQILVADALANPQAVCLDGLCFYSPDI